MRPLYSRFLLAALTAALCLSPAAADDLQAGRSSSADKKSEDIQQLINAQVQAGAKRVVVPPGRYRAGPINGSHLTFRGLNGVTVVADGVELVCTQTVRAVHIEGCTDFTITGLAIDYDPLPFTQGRIVAVAPDRSWADFEVFDGYPARAPAGRIEIYDPATGELRRGDGAGGWADATQPLGGRRFRASKPAGYRYNPATETERVGDVLVANHAHALGPPGWHAVVAVECRRLTLDRVTVFAAYGIGFMESRCERSTYRGCRADRRPSADDPVPRAFPRMRALNQDGFHSENATVGPSIVECTARYLGDDCVNVHGSYNPILSVNGRVVRVTAAWWAAVKPGDPVEFLPASGSRPGDRVATAVTKAGPLTAADRATLARLSLGQIAGRMRREPFELWDVTLDRPTEAGVGALLGTPTRAGAGFVVRGCVFGHNRSRGVLVSAARGEVSGNAITACKMAAVLATPEYGWLSSSYPDWLVVRGNEIRDCREAIRVAATAGDGTPLSAGTIRDVVVADNTISGAAWPAVAVSSVSGLDVRGNRIGPSVAPAPPGQIRPLPVAVDRSETARGEAVPTAGSR